MGINVNLTPQLEELVRSKVASGQYTSVSEVVCEPLRLLEEQATPRWRRDVPNGRMRSGPGTNAGLLRGKEEGAIGDRPRLSCPCSVPLA